MENEPNKHFDKIDQLQVGGITITIWAQLGKPYFTIDFNNTRGEVATLYMAKDENLIRKITYYARHFEKILHAALNATKDNT